MPHARFSGPEYCNLALTPAGTTQATATAVNAPHCLCPSGFATGAGVILQAEPAPGWGTIVNADTAANLIVYPPVGAKLNGQAANSGLTLAPMAACHWVCMNATNFAVVF